jgi:pentatricopeptide repeat protein
MIATRVKLVAPLLAFGLAAALLALVNSDPPASSAPSDERAEAGALVRRGDALVQRARETGDRNGALAARAHRSYRAALRRDPRSVQATVGLGTLALSAHDFAGGLRYGQRARRLAPRLVRPYAVVVDGLVELGRYREAERALQRMVDLKPSLASYARVSYYRELRGDLAGAARAMSLAVASGGGAAENVAYVQTLLGDLELQRGRTDAAELAYGLALARLPGYVDARFGLGRTQAARGKLTAALLTLRRLVRDRPDADHLALLAEVELLTGRRGAARRHLGRAHATEQAALRRGSNPDAGLVLLEADHGDPARALRYGRQVWAAAPSVSSADALGWALTRTGRPAEGLRWARRALRLGTRSPRFAYHAGVSALAAGRPAPARGWLRTAVERRAALTPLEARAAQAALARSV